MRSVCHAFFETTRKMKVESVPNAECVVEKCTIFAVEGKKGTESVHVVAESHGHRL